MHFQNKCAGLSQLAEINRLNVITILVKDRALCARTSTVYQWLFGYLVDLC